VAGMARAMGYTLTGTQKSLGLNLDLLLTVSSTSILRPIQPLSAKLRQHSALI